MIPATQRKIRGAVQRRVPTAQPTKEKLLQTALTLLETHFPEDITGDMILDHSGISRGSLYHHFLDVSDLLEQALVRRFSRRVDAGIDAFNAMFDSCATPDDLYAQLCIMTEETQSQENRQHRFVRARMIGFAEGNDRLTQRLGTEQQRMTDAIARIFAKAQEKGWMNMAFDPTTAALFVQAYTLGRVIDDISLDHVDQASWNDLIKRVIKLVFC